MVKNRLVLSEEPDDILPIEIPVEEIPVDIPMEIEPPVEEVVTNEIQVNAYSDMLQNLLRKQWDVINEADSIVATLNSEEAPAVNREDLVAILNKLTEDTTVAIGMVTKALGVVDPSQEELMTQGVEKAEEVIGASENVDIPDPDGVTFDLSDGSGEPVEVTVKDGELIDDQVEELREEGVSEDYDTLKEVSFAEEEYYDRYWMEEALWQIESMLDVSDEEIAEDEYLSVLNVLDADSLRDLCREAAEAVRNCDAVWETACEVIRDSIYDHVLDYADKIASVEVDLNNKKEGE